MSCGDRIILDSKGKSELLGQQFVKIHSNDNLTVEERRARQRTVGKCLDILEDVGYYDNAINDEFSMWELNRVLNKCRNTTPGEDDISYCMLRNLSDRCKRVLLKLYNKVWEEGNLPEQWKEAIVVPICKPGKDPSVAESYRPIALTSHVGKVMEKMINDRLIYFLERNALLKSHQYGFRRGRSTTDPSLILENEIRKAQVNKECVVAVFFDVEKAYDMMWREGLVIRLHQMGIRGKMLRWVKNFLSGRCISVRVGKEFSSKYVVENGTPQGSIVSPVLFSIMINEIFCNVESSVGVSLFADDGIMWKRGRNVKYIVKKLQQAIDKVEAWSLKWGFRFSENKTKFMFFTKKKVGNDINLTLYGRNLERVNEFKYLGLLFDSRLTWKSHINKVVEKCKKVLNVMRCLRGRDWGASRSCLKTVYVALIRSVLDFGCVVYQSATKSNLEKLDAVQYQALRICCGAVRSTPVSALQVELGEMSLSFRRLQLSLTY